MVAISTLTVQNHVGYANKHVSCLEGDMDYLHKFLLLCSSCLYVLKVPSAVIIESMICILL